MPAKKKLHFAGIGGIGMSALAQMSASLGFATSGSDRAAASPENARIFNALKAQGITIHPQNGSVYNSGTPDILVYSTAVESDNPDIAMAPGTVEHMHRSAALKFLIEACNAKNMIAVTGTSGKTSVTAQMAEALYHLGMDPGVLCGGLVNKFITDGLAGNYRPMGENGYFVVEADESDKSLLNYTADTALVLNIGTDHYSKEELSEVFRKFIVNTRKYVVLSDDVLAAVGADACDGKQVMVFSAKNDAPDTICGFPVVKLDSYRAGTDGAFCAFDGTDEIPLRAPGFHNALNALAVYGTLRLLGFEKADSRNAVCAFSGVWRRFDYAGRISCGAAVYDDYAHNPEKIRAALSALKSYGGHIFAIYQPHGFAPMRLMKDEFIHVLTDIMDNRLTLIMPDIYYVGGTVAKDISSEDVITPLAQMGKQAVYIPNRTDILTYLSGQIKSGDKIVVMGARDDSLSDFAQEIFKTVQGA